MDPLQAIMSLLQAPQPRRPVSVRPDYGLTGAQVLQTQKSPYERTLRPGETRSAEDLQGMLAEVIMAAGSGAVPGINPSGQRLQNPAALSRREFLGKPRITTNRNAEGLKPSLTSDAAAAPAEPFRDNLTIRKGEQFYVVMDGQTPVARYDGDTLVVAPSYRRQGIATDLVYAFRTDRPDFPPAAQRTRASQRVQERVWDRIEREGKNK